jgi:hypothetical protein
MALPIDMESPDGRLEITLARGDRREDERPPDLGDVECGPLHCSR